jgi:hypothetical protein
MFLSGILRRIAGFYSTDPGTVIQFKIFIGRMSIKPS